MRYTTPVIFVIGPTASGKTAVSYELAKQCGGQVINVDVGQFYTPLRIGTAKPAWREHVVSAHLFDICAAPQDFSVVQYRTMVLQKIEELLAQGIIPIVVGGSLFYVQSLFFPPKYVGNVGHEVRVVPEYSWAALADVDLARAAQVHPNDSYRINRALDIWAQGGALPSQLEPQFDFNFNALIYMLAPPKEILQQRVEQRALSMLIDEGWIDEAAGLLDTEWEPFIRSKGLIGYDLIFDALRLGTATPHALAPMIVIQTMQYAKRQLTFMRGFTKKIISLREQKKSIALLLRADHLAVSYEQAARLVAYLQK